MLYSKWSRKAQNLLTNQYRLCKSDVLTLLGGGGGGGWGGAGRWEIDRQRSTEGGRQKQEEMTETGVHGLSRLPDFPSCLYYLPLIVHWFIIPAELDLAYAKYAIIHQSKGPAWTLNK